MEENKLNDEGNIMIHKDQDPNYLKIRSYLILLRANIGDQKEMGENFFNNHKNDEIVFQNLNKIKEDKKESDDMRLQAIVMLRKLYNFSGEYIKYEKPVDEFMQGFLALQSEEMLVDHEENKKKINPLIDSLPYIDNQFDSRIKNEANRLIKEEMEKLSTLKTLDDYLEDFNYPELKFHSDPFIKKELQRHEKNKKLNVIKSEIVTQFENPPPSKHHESKNWEKLIDQVHISLQQIAVKNLNLELMIKYGPEAWKRYLSKLDCLIKQLENEKQNLEMKCEEINLERKFKQTEFSEEMKDLESKLNYYIHQNAGIHKESMILKFKIRKLIKYKKTKLTIKDKKNIKKISTKSTSK